MTTLEKLQRKYPPQSDVSLTRKKLEFNALLKAMRDIEGREPFDQVGYDDLVTQTADLFAYISQRCHVPEGAAVKGFDI